jgi:hypothetical protein
MDYFMLEDLINYTLKLVEIDYAHVALKLATYIIDQIILYLYEFIPNCMC